MHESLSRKEIPLTSIQTNLHGTHTTSSIRHTYYTKHIRTGDTTHTRRTEEVPPRDVSKPDINVRYQPHIHPAVDGRGTKFGQTVR